MPKANGEGRGFGPHLAQVRISPDEEDVKKSQARSRKISRPRPSLVDQDFDFRRRQGTCEQNEGDISRPP